MNEKEFTHIDLFSGIGGFTLAGEWAGFRTVAFCEKDGFCQKVLQKHWPEIPIVEDIRDFDGTKWRGTTLITGGFPCQPFSEAGEQRGEKDDRYLWPEMLRVISEARPRWVLAENVRGIVWVALDTVLADLEDEGYATEALIIPACAVNAPHRRDRVWIIAHSEDKRARTQPRQREKDGLQRRSVYKRQGKGRNPMGTSDSGRSKNTSDSGNKRLEGGGDEKRKDNPMYSRRTNWQKNWLEVAARFCRVDDGLPSWVHSDRVKRLKALGNAIVPQVAYEILEKIARIERKEEE